ncbi:MAG: alpha/beta fold hydrolase [Pseudomonadales bacterium]|nr:alpha/beta fold hydrolase [Pseudomonadales bacterium]
MIQQATEFNVNGSTLRGFFHKPDTAAAEDKLPIVVMGNGFATEWQFGTGAIIKALTSAGIATLNFDYRGFGGSDNLNNQPRQVLDTQAQLADWRAAIAHAKAQAWLAPGKLIFWGSSLGGGHCLTMAAEFANDSALACAVAQVPHCCSREAFKVVSKTSVLKGMGAGIKDSIGSLFGAKPVLLPVVEVPEEYGVMNYPGWKAHYFKIASGSSTWENAIPARSLLKAGDYRPIATADKITVPTLLVAGRQDAGAPFTAVEQTAEKIPQVELYAYDGDHFEVYHGNLLPDIVAHEVSFIQSAID